MSGGESLIREKGDSVRMSIKPREGKDVIIKKLRENGCRVTKQRRLILDTIVENRCSSCKEIYICARKMDPTIGLATVYRMVKELEKIDVLKRMITYK